MTQQSGSFECLLEKRSRQRDPEANPFCLWWEWHSQANQWKMRGNVKMKLDSRRGQMVVGWWTCWWTGCHVWDKEQDNQEANSQVPKSLPQAGSWFSTFHSFNSSVNISWTCPVLTTFPTTIHCFLRLQQILPVLLPLLSQPTVLYLRASTAFTKTQIKSTQSKIQISLAQITTP